RHMMLAVAAHSLCRRAFLFRSWFWSSLCFLFKDTAPTEIYTLSLHDALPISQRSEQRLRHRKRALPIDGRQEHGGFRRRSEEHTSELQSLAYLVCRLLLE